MQHILLDTDIGTDIDDALCLAYLLSRSDCQLEGVTTVSGESEKRASMVDAIAKVAGRKIQIFPGHETPLSQKQCQPIAAQAKQLKNWPHSKSFQPNAAITFMRDTIRKYPHEVTLLAIGPLTNVAVLLATDKELSGLIKEIVIMGGNYDPAYPEDGPNAIEWNIVCDPYAAKIVFESGAKMRCVGADITTQVKMKKEEVRQNAIGQLFKPVMDFADVWFEDCDEIIFHDPLAGTVLFCDEVCDFKRGTVQVDIDDQVAKTIFTETDNGIHLVAVAVNQPLFYREFYETINSNECANQ